VATLDAGGEVRIVTDPQGGLKGIIQNIDPRTGRVEVAAAASGRQTGRPLGAFQVERG
jgi:transcription antitermination factor NusG